MVLDATLLRGAATVVRDRSAIFDRLNRQAGGCQGGDGAFAATAWSVDLDVYFLQTKLQRLFSGLLSCALTGKRRALTASLEATSSGAGPAQRITLAVGDGHLGVVEGCLDMDSPLLDVTSRFSLYDLGHLTISHHNGRSVSS